MKKARPSSIVGEAYRQVGDRFLDSWFSRIECEPSVAKAELLYQGRAFRIARDAASRSACRLAVLSAGLGVVNGSTPIPSYDLSADMLVHRFQVAPSHWWAMALASRCSVDPTTLLAGAPVLLFALTRPYAVLLAPWLESLNSAQTGKLRLFGLGLTDALPQNVHHAILPYDETVPPLSASGIRGDFAARALALHLEGRSRWDLPAEVDEVARLPRLGKKQASRRRVPDRVIREFLCSGKHRSRSSALDGLRARGIACGSERLSRLFAERQADRAI
jgi:hypothetical protein